MSDKIKFKLKESTAVKILLLFITIILIVFMFPQGESIESEVTIGSIWNQEDLIASMTFEVPEDPDIYALKQKEAAEQILPVFIKNDEISRQVIDSAKTFKHTLTEFLDTSTLSINNTPKLGLSFSALQKLQQIHKSSKLITVKNSKSLDDAFSVMLSLLRRIYKKGLLNKAVDDIDKDYIALRSGKFENKVSKTKFYDLESASSFITRYLNNNFSFDLALNQSVAELINLFLKPNINYSEKETQVAIKLAQDVIPRTKYIVNENERIVAKHDRITKEIKDKIDAYRKAKGESTSIIQKATQDLGKFLHIVAILVIYILYISLFRRKIYEDNVKIMLLAILVLFISFLTFLIHQIEVSAPVQYLIFVPAISILVTIIFDSRIGFYTTVIVSLISGGIHSNDYVFSVTNIAAGGLAVFSVRDIKNRSQIFRSFVFILIGYVLSILAFGLESYKSVQEILISSSFAASNALISPILAYGLIIFVERLFKITTDLTLLELTDFNSPLLKELSGKAPGTFNHSLTIGSMVEAAAEVIDAKPILARVGAYYHDIGKTLEPEAFVENQLGENVHDNLNPRESVQLIIRHVQAGIELAREHDLPDEIIDFIPMHHGTMVISFFYEKAKEILGEEKVTKEEFRYPGPKPNTKETTLVMLADACESASRAIDKPDQQKVENIISNIFKQRMEDGQLDDSPITFTELNKIKQSFVNTLVSQHHTRIRYPNQDEMENESGEENA